MKLQHVQVEIERAQNTRELYEGMESGAAALEYLNSQMPIEKVEEIMERTDEALEDRQAIDDLINNKQFFGEADDDEVQQSLDRLIAEDPELRQQYEVETKNTSEELRKSELSTEQGNGTNTEDLPDAPTHRPQISTKKKENQNREPMPVPS